MYSKINSYYKEPTVKIFLLLLSFTLSLIADAFISAESLNTQLNDEKLVVIDVGTKDDYLLKGHVPGAVHSVISEWRMPVEKHYLMRPESELVKKIAELGISNDSKVVLYDHGGPKELLKASYIALTLINLGLENVSILNGGFEEWSYVGDVEKGPVQKKKGNFKASTKKKIIVDKEFVSQNLYKIPMVEARPSKFYFGMEKSPGVKRIGHISGGMSYFWKNSFKNEGDAVLVKSDKELRELLIEGMQLNPSKEMMVYCTGGLEASMNWYILSRVLNFKDVKIYDASMKEWANRDDTPMVKYRWEQFRQN